MAISDQEFARIRNKVLKLEREGTGGGGGSGSSVNIYVENDDTLVGTDFYLSGTNGIVLNSDAGTNQLIISADPDTFSSSFSIFVSGSEPLLSASFIYLSGSTGLRISSSADNKKIIFTPLLTGSSNISASVENIGTDRYYKLFLTGVVPQPSVLSGSYPSPKYLNPSINSADGLIIPVAGTDVSKITWIRLEDPAAVGVPGIGLLGSKGQQSYPYLSDGGRVWLKGGSGSDYGGAGGAVYLAGGGGGGGAVYQAAGPGGNIYIRGGEGGPSGMYSYVPGTGAAGNVYIGDDSTLQVNIGYAGNTTNIYGNTVIQKLTASQLYAPIIGDATGNVSNNIVKKIYGRKLSNRIPKTGDPLIWNEETEYWNSIPVVGGDKNRTLLLHFENGFTDDGYYHLTPLEYYGASTTTFKKVFGSSSLLLYLPSPYYEGGFIRYKDENIASGLAGNSGDFTAEFWFNRSFNSSPPPNINRREIFNIRGTPQDYISSGLQIYVDYSVIYVDGLKYNPYLSSYLPYTIATASVSLDKWYNISFTRTGSMSYVFLDGVLINSASDVFYGNITNLVQFGVTTPEAGGIYGYPGFGGEIDEVRITNNECLYTASYSLATSSFINADGQQLLNIGDISGSFAGFTVIGLQGRSITSSIPPDNSLLVWNSGSQKWTYTPISSISGSGGGSSSYSSVLLGSYHSSGTFGIQDPLELQLPNGIGGFPVADLDRIIYTLSIKETSGSDWSNDLASVQFKVSSSYIYAVISAPSLPYAYSFNAINQNITSSNSYFPSTSSYALTAAYAENVITNNISVSNAYKRLRYSQVGYFDITGSAIVQLPTSSYGGISFTSASFNYIDVSVQIKQNNRWVNDLLAVQLFTSSNIVYVELSAPALTNTDQYKLLAVNEDPTYYII